MFSWLRKRQAERTRLEVSDMVGRLGYTVSQHGFAVNSDESARAEGMRVVLNHTVGLWSCYMPELMCYGPLDGMTDQLLNRIMAVYLEKQDYPQDGDQVLLEERRLTLRRMLHPEGILDIFPLNLLVMDTFPELYGHAPLEAFQVVGDLPPPKAYYVGRPESTRTVAAQEDYSFSLMTHRALIRRRTSQRLYGTTVEVAP